MLESAEILEEIGRAIVRTAEADVPDLQTAIDPDAEVAPVHQKNNVLADENAHCIGTFRHQVCIAHSFNAN